MWGEREHKGMIWTWQERAKDLMGGVLTVLSERWGGEPCL